MNPLVLLCTTINLHASFDAVKNTYYISCNDSDLELGQTPRGGSNQVKSNLVKSNLQGSPRRRIQKGAVELSQKERIYGCFAEDASTVGLESSPAQRRFRICWQINIGGRVEGWSEKASSRSEVGLAGVAPLHFGGEPNVGAHRWYALYVRSRHEKTVENSLRGKGYSVFSPSYRTKRKRIDRIAEIEVALFPGYVFCYFDSNKRMPILMTPGIVRIVGSGNRPEPVDENEIASIRTIALSGRPVQPWPFLSSGQRIRLQAGPLMGAEGIFLRVKDEYHLVVAITLLQRAISVVVEAEAVAPLLTRDRPTNSFER
jgi:transcriptional antiterminator NusG